MTRRRRLNPKDLMAPAAVATVAATAFAVLLSILATPGNLSERIAGVSSRAEALQTSYGAVRASKPTEARLLCASSAERAKYDLQAEIASAGGGQGVAISDFHADVQPGGDESAAQPVIFHFTATGPYDGVVGILRRLAARRGEVFVDSVDLVSNTTSVTLNFAGRVFCAA